MKNSFYIEADLNTCRALGHRFQVVGSDKTPLKRSLLCLTCTEANPGKTAYVAYGDDLQSWGLWRKKRDEHQKVRSEEESL